MPSTYCLLRHGVSPRDPHLVAPTLPTDEELDAALLIPAVYARRPDTSASADLSGQVAALKEELQGLSSQMGQLQHSAAEWQAAAAAGLDAKQATAARELAALGSAVAALQQVSSTAGGRLDDLSRHVDTAAAEASARTQAVAAGLQASREQWAVTAAAPAPTTTVAEAAALAEVQAQVRALQEAQQGAAQRQEAGSEGIKRLAAALQAAEAAAEAQAAQHDQLSSQVAQLEAATAQQAEATRRTAPAAAEAVASLAAIQAQLAAVQAAVDDTNQRLFELRVEVQNAAGDAAAEHASGDSAAASAAGVQQLVQQEVQAGMMAAGLVMSTADGAQGGGRLSAMVHEVAAELAGVKLSLAQQAAAAEEAARGAATAGVQRLDCLQAAMAAAELRLEEQGRQLDRLESRGSSRADGGSAAAAAAAVETAACLESLNAIVRRQAGELQQLKQVLAAVQAGAEVAAAAAAATATRQMPKQDEQQQPQVEAEPVTEAGWQRCTEAAMAQVLEEVAEQMGALKARVDRAEACASASAAHAEAAAAVVQQQAAAVHALLASPRNNRTGGGGGGGGEHRQAAAAPPSGSAASQIAIVCRQASLRRSLSLSQQAEASLYSTRQLQQELLYSPRRHPERPDSAQPEVLPQGYSHSDGMQSAGSATFAGEGIETLAEPSLRERYSTSSSSSTSCTQDQELAAANEDAAAAVAVAASAPAPSSRRHTQSSNGGGAHFTPRSRQPTASGGNTQRGGALPEAASSASSWGPIDALLPQGSSAMFSPRG